jgi:hypothetical protein
MKRAECESPNPFPTPIAFVSASGEMDQGGIVFCAGKKMPDVKQAMGCNAVFVHLPIDVVADYINHLLEPATCQGSGVSVYVSCGS